MADNKHNMRTIETYRMLAEERVRHLLGKVDNPARFETIQAMIYDFERDDFQLYLFAMLRAFRCKSIEATDQETLQVIQDAWNYFPHRDLGNRCPAELMAQEISNNPL